MLIIFVNKNFLNFGGIFQKWWSNFEKMLDKFWELSFYYKLQSRFHKRNYFLNNLEEYIGYSKKQQGNFGVILQKYYHTGGEVLELLKRFLMLKNF